MKQEKTKITEPKRYFVPCPHCGHFQLLDFWRLNFTENISGTLTAADYRCRECDALICDEDKNEMLARGEWRGEGELHLNTLYSPWKSFKSVVRQFLDSKDNPATMRRFINCWLAKPWIGSDGQPEVPDEPIELVWGTTGIRLSEDFTFEVANPAKFFADELARLAISNDR